MDDLFAVSQSRENLVFIFRTVLGWCGARVTPRGVAGFALPVGVKREAVHRVQERFYVSPSRDNADAVVVEMARTVRQQVCAYFLKERQEFDLELDWSGATEFRKKVWGALCEIPYGVICSYGDVAASIGCATARPVGQALAKNPIPLIVPCHRVVDARGRLHGFSGDGGLDMKRDLLLLEGASGWIES